ncbi:MAG: AMP-binding protein, partial [Candidatus Rokubacteria bacterium]|nr:AMP-binding protein [Candidatus Rokubacteria bacterium]
LGIFYTGGTTGVPKGVMLSHQNMLANATIMTGGLGYTAEDVHLHASPMFHVGDVGCVWAALFAGGAHAFLPVFTPGGFVGAVARARVTTTMLAPSMITLLVRSGALEAADLSSWTTLLYGGSSITVDTLRRALADLPCRLFQSYGLAEATQGVCLLRPEEHVRARSCGRPMLGVQVRVADVRLDAVAPGEPGEIVVRGPTVMKGYWRRSLETAEALRGGWLRTGDLATVDEDGFVYLLDRQRDMIISGGENCPTRCGASACTPSSSPPPAPPSWRPSWRCTAGG